MLRGEDFLFALSNASNGTRVGVHYVPGDKYRWKIDMEDNLLPEQGLESRLVPRNILDAGYFFPKTRDFLSALLSSRHPYQKGSETIVQYFTRALEHGRVYRGQDIQAQDISEAVIDHMYIVMGKGVVLDFVVENDLHYPVEESAYAPGVSYKKEVTHFNTTLRYQGTLELDSVKNELQAYERPLKGLPSHVRVHSLSVI